MRHQVPKWQLLIQEVLSNVLWQVKRCTLQLHIVSGSRYVHKGIRAPVEAGLHGRPDAQVAAADAGSPE